MISMISIIYMIIRDYINSYIVEYNWPLIPVSIILLSESMIRMIGFSINDIMIIN